MARKALGARPSLLSVNGSVKPASVGGVRNACRRVVVVDCGLLVTLGCSSVLGGALTVTCGLSDLRRPGVRLGGTPVSLSRPVMGFCVMSCRFVRRVRGALRAFMGRRLTCCKARAALCQLGGPYARLVGTMSALARHAANVYPIRGSWC